MQAFLLLFLSEILLLKLTSATTLKVQRQNMRVRISAVGDTIVFKFIRPHVDTRLEGYILGYGRSMFSKQFIQLPEDGQPYETEIVAEPKYLIALQSKNLEEPKKICAGKVDLEKPLNIVISSVTQSSVLLSWGTLMTSPFMDTILDDCFDEGQFTVRYREKELSNTWNYQTCPSTSTVIDNLKPDALYEFAVRADTVTNCGVWSPAVIHNTADQIIEPFKELNQAKSKKPILARQRSFLPPVPVLNNINQTRAAPLLIHTRLPKPRKTSGAENSTMVPNHLRASTKALPSSHTSIILPMPKTTSTVRPRNLISHTSTTQTDLITEQHTSITPKQPTTSQPQPSRTQQKSSTTLPPPTTIQQYTIKTQISVKALPYTAKQLLNTAQHHFSETSSHNPPTTKPLIPQTLQLSKSTIKEHPHPSKKQDTITQGSLHTRKIQPSTKLHRLSTTQRSRGMSKHQSTHTYFPKTTSHYQSSTIAHSEQPNTKPPPPTQNWSTNSHSLTNTALTSPTTLANIVLVTDKHTDVLVSKLKTKVSKHPVFSTNPSISKEYSTSHIPTTEYPPLTENIQELTPHPLYLPITFWYQSRPSTATKHSSTIKQQASTAKYNLKMDSQVENRQPTPEESLPVTPKNLSKLTPQTAFTKSDAVKNSPVAEKVTVGTSHPNRPAGNFSRHMM